MFQLVLSRHTFNDTNTHTNIAYGYPTAIDMDTKIPSRIDTDTPSRIHTDTDTNTGIRLFFWYWYHTDTWVRSQDTDTDTWLRIHTDTGTDALVRIHTRASTNTWDEQVIFVKIHNHNRSCKCCDRRFSKLANRVELWLILSKSKWNITR